MFKEYVWFWCVSMNRRNENLEWGPRAKRFHLEGDDTPGASGTVPQCARKQQPRIQSSTACAVISEGSPPATFWATIKRRASTRIFGSCNPNQQAPATDARPPIPTVN